MPEQETDERLQQLFWMGERLPCPDGMGLFRIFAASRPADLSFLRPDELVDPDNSAFAGIPEWEAFCKHYGACELCNA